MPRLAPLKRTPETTMTPRQSLLASLLSLAALTSITAPASAGSTDISYPPATPSGGHDFNHAPVGQSFTAQAAKVKAGLYLADETSFSGGAGYPYTVAPSIRTNVKLINGEGTSGTVLDSRDITLTAPYKGFVYVDYAAAGITLNVGSLYTLLVTDISSVAYPSSMTGWIVPSVHDYSTGASLPPGAYTGGLPILQGALVTNDAGIGDNAFSVIDLNGTGGGTTPPPTPGCASSNVAIRVVASSYIDVATASGSISRVFYAPSSSTTFQGGATGYSVGELVSYTGSLEIGGCRAGSMTVMPAPTPVTIGGTLPYGQVGTPYSATLTAAGGTAPYRWLASGIPAGLSFSNGVLSGTPSIAGISTLTVDLSDAAGRTTRSTYSVTINAAPLDACSKPSSTKLLTGSGLITAVSSTSITVGLQKLSRSSCTTIRYKNKDTALKVGQYVDWSGWTVSGSMMVKDINVLR